MRELRYTPFRRARSCAVVPGVATSNAPAVDRYYDPATDQFLSVDPELAETGQAYAFTGDDPLNRTDPLGLESEKTLSKQEQDLLNESTNGRTLKDGKALTPAQRRVWNSANQKRIFNEKSRRTNSQCSKENQQCVQSAYSNTPFLTRHLGLDRRRRTRASRRSRMCLWST